MTLAPTNARTPVAVATPARKPRGRRWRRRRSRTFYLFVSPWVTGLVLFTAFPLGYALWLSFTNYDGFSPHWSVVGWKNYSTAIHDPATWESLGRTMVLVAVVVPAMIAFGLLLAVLVNQKVPGRGIFRAIFFIPVVVPPVAAGFVFRMLFDRDTGPVTTVLGWFGVAPVQWFVDNKALLVLMLMILWGVGTNMVISLAGLQGVPQDLMDAAAIDGATTWRRFWRVTVPLLSPVLFFQLVLGVIGTMQLYLPALLLSAGGQASISTAPGKGLQVYLVHVYSEAFVNGNLGYAAALLWLLTAVTVLYTLVIFKMSKRMVYYEAGIGEAGR